jgi:hypothetical protein
LVDRRFARDRYRDCVVQSDHRETARCLSAIHSSVVRIAPEGWARRAALASALLYGATVMSLWATREVGGGPLPPHWFYFAYAVLPTIAGVLPLAVRFRSRWLRFCLFLVAMYCYGVVWFHQLRLNGLLGLGLFDARWLVELTNFISMWDRPFSWSYLAAAVCLGWLAAGRPDR